jgi:branched-subunit amino acid transport protein
MASPRMSDAVRQFVGDWHALLILLVAGVIPNQIWRMLGLWLGSGLDEGSEFLVWVRAVATAVLAGVIAQIVVQPPGALASVPDWLRYSAVVAGFAAFMMARKSIFVGVMAGEAVMLAGKWWLG